MKADELRIGNYILHHNHKIKESFDECIVWMISEDHLRVRVNDLHNEVVSADYCSGITLTEELFNKCEQLSGIGTSINTEYWTTGFINLDFNDDKTVRVTLVNGNIYLATIEFLHDWQNLYFALTGEELHL